MIRQISAEETYELRREILRPGRPTRECFFDGDLETDTIHLGYFDEGILSGIATFVLRSNDQFSNPRQYQLRGMAVLPQYRGKYVGTKLLVEGENLLKSRNPDILIWFNARESAVAFYEKHGYRSIGSPFMIPNVCMHLVMYKNPTKS